MKRRGKFIEFTQIDTRESDFDRLETLVSIKEELICRVICDPEGFARIITTDGQSCDSGEEYETFMTALSHTD